jgi:hypothetical protein
MLMFEKSPLRSTQSSSSVRVSRVSGKRGSRVCQAVTHLPLMPLQHVSQLPSKPARHSARSAAVLTLVAVAPSQVKPLGQAVHTLSLTYSPVAHSVRTSLP